MAKYELHKKCVLCNFTRGSSRFGRGEEVCLNCKTSSQSVRERLVICGDCGDRRPGSTGAISGNIPRCFECLAQRNRDKYSKRSA